MHETKATPITINCPRQLRNKNAQEIVAYLSEHYTTRFVYDETGQLIGNEPVNKATAYMMAVSKAIFDPTDWKAPCKVWFPVCGHEWVKAAIIWYHGAEPVENKYYWVYSRGYSC